MSYKSQYLPGRRRRLAALLFAAAAAAALESCASGEDNDGPGGAATSATGAGGLDFDPGVTGPCAEAVAQKQSVGCDYYATFMDTFNGADACFAAVVANTGDEAVHIKVEYDGEALPVGEFTRIPKGSGPALTYEPFDAAAGLPPGEVALLFLSGPKGEPTALNAPCPVDSAVPEGVYLTDNGSQGRSGIGKSFHIQSDRPVVAYQVLPFGGGSAALTGASLLLPTSAWDTNYVAANAYKNGTGKPSLNIVAMDDNTAVTILPVAAVEGGSGIPSGAAGAPLKLTLNAGEHAQISQSAPLTGSVVQSTKPVGFMAGHQCMYIPETIGACDHGEQMVPPVRALGSEYVGVMYEPRTTEPAVWRLIGAADGTKLTWSADVGGPSSLSLGEEVEIVTGTPFVVKSQDAEHPFILFQHMSGSAWDPFKYGMLYIGDPDAVLSVPPKQYMTSYVFFADPTYPRTNLVVVRSKKDGAFADVTLDCAGALGGWQPVGEYEWTRVDLNKGIFEGVGGCDTGRHEISSSAPFGLWVWGWGSPETGDYETGTLTRSVSYGYPGGMNVEAINDVVVPVPK